MLMSMAYCGPDGNPGPANTRARHDGAALTLADWPVPDL